MQRLPGAPSRSAPAMAATGRPSVALAEGRATAATLRAAGMNVDLAPVVDVVRPESALHAEGRGFGFTAASAARFGAAFTRGLRAGGVAATAKHFPGFGAAPANTDLGEVRMALGLRELRAVDRPPFEAAIRAGARLVMLSSATYPALSPRTGGALARAWCRASCATGLGFDGVTVSDDLEAPAFASRGGASGAALAATRAGVDLLLFARTYDGADRAARRARRRAALGPRGSRRCRGFAGSRAGPPRGVAASARSCDRIAPARQSQKGLICREIYVIRAAAACVIAAVMSHDLPRRSSFMRKLAILTVALLAALTAGVLAVTAGSGSSHREAPLSALDPTADDTDVYAFVAPDAPGSVTLIGNWIPFEDPAGGPNFYRFDDRASYYLNVDNTGDGKYDIRYRFKFKTKARNPNSFLYALPGVSSFNDPKLNLVQTYSVWRERYEQRPPREHQAAGQRPARGAEQRRAQDDPELRRGRQPGDQVAAGRRQGLLRPGRRPVLRRPRLDLRRHQHRHAGPHGHRHGQPGRRQGRPRRLQRPLDRPAGPQGRRHPRRQDARRRQGARRGRRRLGLDGSPGVAGHPPEPGGRARPPPGRPRAGSGSPTTTARARSAAWATRSSTR